MTVYGTFHWFDYSLYVSSIYNASEIPITQKLSAVDLKQLFLSSSVVDICLKVLQNRTAVPLITIHDSVQTVKKLVFEFIDLGQL